MNQNSKTEIVPAVCQALALLPSGAEAINRIYNRDRGRFYSAALQNPNINDPHFGAGRAEHRINAIKALGIFTAGTLEEQKQLLRSADRKSFDTLLAASKRLKDGERMVIDHIVDANRNESDDYFFARCIVLLGISCVLGVLVEYTEFVQDLVQAMINHKRGAAARQNRSRDEKSIAAMKKALGSDRINGITGLYDSFSNANREKYDHIFNLLNAEGIDGGLYTDSVILTPLDASSITAKGDPAVNAIIMLLARTIHLDRDTCFKLYNDTRPDRIDAAKHDAEMAKTSEKAALLRVKNLEQKVLELTRKVSDLESELRGRDGDKEELASLREAVYNAADSTPIIQEAEHRREIPEGVIVIGGHPSWARQLSDQTGVRCWASGTTCPNSVIDAATEIWIQAAYMAHSDYYAVINRARNGSKTVRYFSTTGVAKCIKELLSV